MSEPGTARLAESDVVHVAKLARLAITADEVERYTTQLGGMLEHFADIDSLDLSSVLERIQVPTLVLAGERDVVVPPTQQAALANALPAGRFAQLAGAGHIGFLTHEREFARAVKMEIARATCATS